MRQNHKSHRAASPSSRQISPQIRQRMKGEHSLQVDQSGESFRGHEQASGATVYQHQQQDVPQINARQHHH